MFAAAWLPCGEKVLYRNRQGSSESSETILYRVNWKPIRRCSLVLISTQPARFKRFSDDLPAHHKPSDHALTPSEKSSRRFS
ncbi:hypothetical protein [Neisseria sicca]|uniref:hypothetical protein n=1 Tax=Neisseria sicca TaxID=490 RepID=UPI0011BD1773|nr:hypothetical protein [Neisseria sicca]